MGRGSLYDFFLDKETHHFHFWNNFLCALNINITAINTVKHLHYLYCQYLRWSAIIFHYNNSIMSSKVVYTAPSTRKHYLICLIPCLNIFLNYYIFKCRAPSVLWFRYQSSHILWILTYIIIDGIFLSVRYQYIVYLWSIHTMHSKLCQWYIQKKSM